MQSDLQTFVVIVISPPSITSQPSSRTNNAGTTATFSVVADGSNPLTYQWKKGDVNLTDGGNVSGANSATLTLANVLAADATNYSVVVSNTAGSATSNPAVLTVNDPVITVQPSSHSAGVGSTTTFSITAIGTAPVNYQWRKGGSDLSDGGNVSGAQTATLTLSNVTQSDATNYSVLVNNAVGVVASSSAILTLTGLDTTPPTVSIDSPKNNAQLSTSAATLSGTAKDTLPGVIVDVKYRVWPETIFTSATTLSPPVNGKLTWTVPNLPLTPGTNIIHAYSIDAGGNSSPIKTNKFFYNSTSPLTVRIAGSGFVKSSTLPNIVHNQTIPLLVGRPYALTAFVPPGTTNFVFTNWMGGTNLATLAQASANPVYGFQMESNLILEANFIPNPFLPVAGTYSGLFSETNNAIAHRSAGFFTVKVTGKAAYSCKLIFDGDTFSGGGKLDLSGQASRVIKRDKKGKTNLNLTLALDWVGGQIHGTVSDGNWTSEMLGYKATYSSTNPATEFLGAYTFLVPQTNYPVPPGGFGYAAVTNNILGVVSLKGGLADGSKIVQKVSLSADGKWPFYVQLYRSTNLTLPIINKADYRGSLMGWVTFTNDRPQGTLNWIKTSNAAPNYFNPAGFTSVVQLVSSRYQPPNPGERMLNIVNGTISFTDGNLSGPLAYNVTWASNNVISVPPFINKPTFSIATKTGLLKGTFFHPQLGKTNYFGAVLQQQKYAGGYFLGTNQSGAMRLDEN
jgi:hypothetical protein